MDVSCVHGSVYRVVLWQLAMETAQLMARTMHCSSVSYHDSECKLDRIFHGATPSPQGSSQSFSVLHSTTKKTKEY